MPALSVVLPALGGIETVRVALDAWQAQTRRDELELVVPCPDGEAAGRARGLRAVDSRGLLLHEARARGIRESRAAFVVLAEDHCVPDPTRSEALLPRLAEGWDAIGGLLRPGDLTRPGSQAAFLLGYGEWMAPRATGPIRVLPGHNVVLRRAPLLDLGGELEELLLVSAFLLRRPGSGRRLLVAEAVMTHYDVTSLRRQLDVFHTIGRAFGAVRVRRAPLPVRLGFVAAAPLLAAAHWRRGLAHYRRGGRANGMRPACLAAAALLAGAWGAGEAVGALQGTRRVARDVWRSETNPLRPTALDP